MTRDELRALALALPADVLVSYANIGRHLPGVTHVEKAVDYILAQGWWQSRRQWGIVELWRDGKPEWQATIQSKPRTPTVGVPAATPAAAPARPVAEKPKKKQPTAPTLGGLFT